MSCRYIVVDFFKPPLRLGVLASFRPSGIEPITRAGKPRVKLSLAGYSFRKELDLKKKPKPEMTYFDFIDLAATYPLDAVELTAYYFPETTPEYLAALKGRAGRLGLDISGTAVGNDFCQLDADKQQKQIADVKLWIEHTSRLGGKTMRIFAGKVTKGDTEEKARERSVQAIEEVCEYAAKFGVWLAIENHAGGLMDSADQMLLLLKAVKSPWFGVNWDTGNFRTADPYEDLTKIAPYAVTVQMKTDIQPAGKPKQDADYAKLFGILATANYRGYVALEYEGDEETRSGVPKALEAMSKFAK